MMQMACAEACVPYWEFFYQHSTSTSGSTSCVCESSIRFITPVLLMSLFEDLAVSMATVFVTCGRDHEGKTCGQDEVEGIDHEALYVVDVQLWRTQRKQ